MKSAAQQYLVESVWVGDFGQYKIPEQFLSIKVSKRGLPDKRFKKAEQLMKWAAEQEIKARQEMEAKQ